MAESRTIEKGFWNIKDLSFYLKVKVKTLYAMVQEIPHYRVGKLIRFKKEEIEYWMESKRVKVRDGGKRSKERTNPLPKSNIPIDRLIRKTIDQAKQESYNPRHGKSDHVKGLTGKEVDHGLI